MQGRLNPEADWEDEAMHALVTCMLQHIPIQITSHMNRHVTGQATSQAQWYSKSFVSNVFSQKYKKALQV